MSMNEFDISVCEYVACRFIERCCEPETIKREPTGMITAYSYKEQKRVILCHSDSPNKGAEMIKEIKHQLSKKITFPNDTTRY